MKEVRFNTVPIVVQQMVESVVDKTTPMNTRFNQSQMIRNIRDYCDLALKEYEKQEAKSHKNY